MTPNPDPGEPGARDQGLARERTSLAWTRTALSFAAVGGVMLRRDVVPGLIILTAPRPSGSSAACPGTSRAGSS
jgi:uncharacterized membrane protein YidH (DUF202 family)